MRRVSGEHMTPDPQATGTSCTIPQAVRPGPAARTVGLQLLQPHPRSTRCVLGERMVAPEPQLATEHFNARIISFFLTQVFCRVHSNVSRCAAVDDLLRDDFIHINVEEEERLGADRAALVQRIADKRLGGRISDELREKVIARVNKAPASDATQSVAEALYPIASSLELALLP